MKLIMKSELDEAVKRFLDEERLPENYVELIDRIYRPIAAEIITRHASSTTCSVIGLCGPQGSGKSTGAKALKLLLEAQGLTTAVLSIDDLYLTKQARAALGTSVHPLLETRGPPGTHDVDLGKELLDALRSDRPVPLPTFDKAIDDRRPMDEEPLLTGPIEILIFEGWCVGARAQPAVALKMPVNALEADEDSHGTWRHYVNAALEDYRVLFDQIDYLVYLRPPSFEVVAAWRQEQEDKLRAKLGQSDAVGLMDGRQITRFIQHYERLTRHIIDDLTERADALIDLDAERTPTLIRVRVAIGA